MKNLNLERRLILEQIGVCAREANIALSDKTRMEKYIEVERDDTQIAKYQQRIIGSINEYDAAVEKLNELISEL